ncbi:WXG100 family type VII secretion target [Nocardia gipuzkoensis]|uniref:WXG100 family type VII secretion target n=1 Tax=Nocardia gipuzkoensis TaxID=2749991 RepID=UPI0015EF14D2|nr:WXG100 family type VII secretion target [Nocardia gipuzkoensis]
MSSRFTVDIDQLEQVTTQLTGLAGFIEDQLDGLDSRVAAILSGSWNGVAAEAFGDAHSQWMAAAKELVDSIRTSSSAARQARDRYVTAADLNRQMS